MFGSTQVEPIITSLKSTTITSKRVQQNQNKANKFITEINRRRRHSRGTTPHYKRMNLTEVSSQYDDTMEHIWRVLQDCGVAPSR
mmetsp:Transcript_20876/g.25840  ORF Transcript_20876/g.25840 Transcript_20876/m.25840 type:complete len:85 (+) Transcript_20876:158-412(+)